MKNELPQYKTDYIISWDFSGTDHPCVSVSRVGRREDRVECEVLGTSFAKSGVISLLQVNEEHEYLKRKDTERTQNAREILEKTFHIKSEDKEVMEEPGDLLYNQTVKRLARLGAKSHTAQIIALAEEIEYYREKIQRMEAPSE